MSDTAPPPAEMRRSHPARGLVPLDVAAVGAVAAAAVLIRTLPVATASFPLNDGGLFFAMARDLQHAGLQLPAATSYNGEGIPFVYPPLGLYIVAVASSSLPVSLLDLFRWVPVLFSVLSVAAMCLVAQQLLPSRFHALVATAAFAVAPQAYQWVIEGGGVTRSPGLFFALLTVWLAARAFRDQDRRTAILAGVCGGLAMLSHPDAALFSVLAVFLLAARRLDRLAITRAVVVYAVMAVVGSPWWGIAVMRVGLAGIVSAGSLAGPLGDLLAGTFTLVTFNFTSEAYLPVVGALGLLGALVSASRRAWFLPGWLALEILTDARLGAMYAMVPLSMLAAVGLVDVVIPALSATTWSRSAPSLLPPALWRARSVRWVLIFGLAITTIAALVFAASPVSPDRAVSDSVRAAATWTGRHTTPGAQFAVVTGEAAGWEGEQEWFPVLAGRVSQATPQGTEWLGAGRWRQLYLANAALQACASEDARCLLTWSAQQRIPLQYVFLPKGQLRGPTSPPDCCSSLRLSLRASPAFVIVYDGPGATIYRATAAATGQ